ncbi:MAG: hypothetical protein JWR80_8842 [Bradyrhizobium sp.]|nr:hypothetical protein [Bradyrhizobium sp.]
MKQIFIELFNYKNSWHELSERARVEYLEAVLDAVNRQKEDGVEVISWGFNASATDRRAPYDFYCVYVTPSAEYQRGFEAAISAAGWYDYFEQINVSGAVSTPDAMARSYAMLDTAAKR